MKLQAALAYFNGQMLKALQNGKVIKPILLDYILLIVGGRCESK